MVNYNSRSRPPFHRILPNSPMPTHDTAEPSYIGALWLMQRMHLSPQAGKGSPIGHMELQVALTVGLGVGAELEWEWEWEWQC